MDALEQTLLSKAEYRDSVKEAFSKKTPVKFEITFTQNEGAIGPFGIAEEQTLLVSVTPLIHGGRPDLAMVILEDLSDKRKLKRELQFQKRLIRSLADVANEGMIVTDPSGKITYANQFMTATLSIPANQVLGQNISTLFADKEAFDQVYSFLRGERDDIRIASPEFRLLLLDPRTRGVRYETEFLDKSGNKLTFHMSEFSVKDDEGRMNSIVSIGRDVTDLKRLQENIQRTNKELVVMNAVLQIVNQSANVQDLVEDIFNRVLSLLDIDMGGIYLLKSSELKLIVQKNVPEELLGMIAAIPLEECFMGKAIRERRTITTEETGFNEVIGKGMRVKGVKAAASVPLISKGRVFGAIAAASVSKEKFDSRDVDLLNSIGEQLAVGMENIILMAKSKRAEEHYKTLFDNAGNPIVVLDEEGKGVLVNREFERLSGYTREELDKFGPLYNMVCEEDRGKAIKYHSTRRQGGYAPHRYTTALNNAKGEKRIVDVAVSMLPGSGNSIVSMVDVTDLVKVREDLERNVRDRTQQLYAAQQELIDKERLAVVGTLAASVSHELRNPLAVVQNTIDLLRIKEPQIAAQVKDYLCRMEGEMDRVSKIIDDMLAYSELGTASPRRLLAPRMLKDALKTMNVPKNIDLVTDLQDCPDVFVDPVQMDRVLRSVILNSIQAMPEGGKLTISTRLRKAGEIIERSSSSIGSREENGGDEVMIVVEDTGAGIDPEVLPSIFTPMFTTKVKGLGLGLSLSKNVVEQNRGRIWIESTKGRGTIVTIAFPTREE